MKLLAGIIITGVLIICTTSCNDPISSSTNDIDTVYIHDTIRVHDKVFIHDTLVKYDTIYAKPILSGTSKLITKTVIDTAFEYSFLGNSLRVFWPEIPNALGYRLFVEIPGVGTFSTNSPSSKTTYTGLEGFWEASFKHTDLIQYINKSMAIHFYVVGVDKDGLDGPVSDSYPFMFYP